MKIFISTLLLALALRPANAQAWYKKTSGTCATPITTADECKTATTTWNGYVPANTGSLRSRSTVVDEVNLADEPAGCTATDFGVDAEEASWDNFDFSDPKMASSTCTKTAILH